MTTLTYSVESSSASAELIARRRVVKDSLALIPTLGFLFVYCLILGPDRGAEGPVRDPGMYSYVGRIIAGGGTPYLDAWDHKGPLLYLVHALSNWLSPGAVEPLVTYSVILGLALFAAAIFLHGELSAIVDRRCSIVALCVGFCALYILSHPAMAEPLAVPLQLMALAALLRCARSGDASGLVLIGAAVGATLLIRVDLASLPILLACSAAFFIPLHLWFNGGVRLASGFAIVIVPVLAWLYLGGALHAMFDQYIHYNSVYSSASPPERMRSAASLFFTFNLAHIFGPLALVGWGVVSAQGLAGAGSRSAEGLNVHQVFRRRRRNNVLLLVAAGLFAIEFLLCFISGRDYDHYLVRLVPLGVLMASVAVDTFWKGVRFQGNASMTVGASVVVAVVGLSAIGPHIRAMMRGGPDAEKALIVYLNGQLRPGEPLFVYGADGTVYNRTHTVAPTPYFYLYPLITAGYSRQEKADAFLSALQARPPRLIVEMPNPRLTPLGSAEAVGRIESAYIRDTEALSSARSWIAKHYAPRKTVAVGGGVAQVWEYVNSGT